MKIITIKSIYTPSRYNDDVNEHQYRNKIETFVYRNKSSGGKWAYMAIWIWNRKHTTTYVYVGCRASSISTWYASTQKHREYIEIWNNRNFSIFNFISGNKKIIKMRRKKTKIESVRLAIINYDIIYILGLTNPSIIFF